MLPCPMFATVFASAEEGHFSKFVKSLSCFKVNIGSSAPSFKAGGLPVVGGQTNTMYKLVGISFLPLVWITLFDAITNMVDANKHSTKYPGQELTDSALFLTNIATASSGKREL